MRRPIQLMVMAALMGGGVACSKSGEQPAPAVAQENAAYRLQQAALTEVSTRLIRPSFEMPALMEPIQSATIRPEVQAVLKSNHFTAGQLIEEGALLVELDPAKFEAGVAAARAGLQAARANAVQAATNWKRAQQLMPKGYISAMDYDRAQASIGTANASVAQAAANLEQAELQLSRSTIIAPFSGKISEPYHAEGDLVGPLAIEPLFELVQLDPIYANANVQLSAYNAFVMLRMKAAEQGVEIPELEVFIELAGGGEYPHMGRFEAWAHSTSGSQGTIAARVVFPNPDGLLLPGQTVTLRGRAASAVERMMVPQKAVMQDQQGHYVKIVDAEGAVRRKNIEVGIREGVDWAVPLGLTPGDRVIVEGAGALKEGVLVEIVPAP